MHNLYDEHLTANCRIVSSISTLYLLTVFIWITHFGENHIYAAAINSYKIVHEDLFTLCCLAHIIFLCGRTMRHVVTDERNSSQLNVQIRVCRISQVTRLHKLPGADSIHSTPTAVVVSKCGKQWYLGLTLHVYIAWGERRSLGVSSINAMHNGRLKLERDEIYYICESNQNSVERNKFV